MKTEKSVFLMLGILFLGVILSIFLIFLESNIPVILILALGVIYTIIIDLVLLYKKPEKQPKTQPKEIGPIYNDLLKTSIELNDKMDKLGKRQQQLKKIAEDAKKTISLANDVKKQIRQVKHIKPRKKYIASVNSDKFHDTHCKFTKLISPKNKIQFTTKTQALKQGFKPCEELLNGTLRNK